MFHDVIVYHHKNYLDDKKSILIEERIKKKSEIINFIV